MCKAPSQIVTTNKPTPNFLQVGCGVPFLSPNQQCLSTEGERNITFHGLAHPKLVRGLVTLTIKGSWLPWRRVAVPLVSPLTPVPQIAFLHCIS